VIRNHQGGWNMAATKRANRATTGKTRDGRRKVPVIPRGAAGLAKGLDREELFAERTIDSLGDVSGSLGVVAVVPFWSQSDNLNADSNYAYLRMVLPELQRAAPGTLFCVFFPDPHYSVDRWRYVDDGLQSDRVKFVPWPYDSAMRSSVLGFDPVRFKQIEERYCPTIYWLHQVESGAFMDGGYKGSFSIINRPTLVAQHHYVIHKSLPYPLDGLFARRWLQTGGSLCADAVIFNSDHAARMADESFRDLLSPQAADDIKAKSATFRFGLIAGDEPTAPATAGDAPPVIIYNHRFEAYKLPDATFNAIAGARSRGHKFEVWATQTTGQMTSDYAIDRAVGAPKRADYLRAIAVPGINTVNSVHETFCISMLDSIAIGHLPVAPDAITFPELVPPGYPFLFKTPAEQLAMLDHILATWPLEYDRWAATLQRHARDHFAAGPYAARYRDLFSRLEAERLGRPVKDATAKTLDRCFASLIAGRPAYPRALATPLNNGDFGRKLGAQAMSPRRIVREAVRRGIPLAFGAQGTAIVPRQDDLDKLRSVLDTE
jgi:glycosyltransferase involved in cell wall biosynthesis